MTVTVKRTSNRKQIGSASTTIAAGKSATIHFKLTASARTALRRSGKLKATVAITARHATATSTRTVQLTLNRKA